MTPSQIADLRLAASKMKGPKKREFLAEMTIKYCNGSARVSETIFGWNRKTVKLGLAEKKTGIICIGAKLGRSGRKRWEDQNPEIAEKLMELAEAHGQQDPSFKSTICYTRLTASAAIMELKKLGYSEEKLPKPSTMNDILNRMGYRLRKVVKAKPQKKYQKQMLSSPILK